MRWRFLTDEDGTRLEYGAFTFGDASARVSFVRSNAFQSVELTVRLRPPASPADGEAPRFARFSFDSGEKSNRYVGGVGSIQRARDGGLIFTTGDSDLSLFHPVLDDITDQLGFLIDDEAYDFPIDPEARTRLLSLFDRS